MCFFPAVHCWNSLSLAVGERDALRWHFEVDGGGGRQWAAGQRLADGLGHSLRTCQWLHVDRVDVKDVARCMTAVGKSKTFFFLNIKGNHQKEQRAKQNGAGSFFFFFTVSVLKNLLDYRRKKTEQISWIIFMIKTLTINGTNSQFTMSPWQ